VPDWPRSIGRKDFGWIAAIPKRRLFGPRLGPVILGIASEMGVSPIRFNERLGDYASIEDADMLASWMRWSIDFCGGNPRRLALAVSISHESPATS